MRLLPAFRMALVPTGSRGAATARTSALTRRRVGEPPKSAVHCGGSAHFHDRSKARSTYPLLPSSHLGTGRPLGRKNSGLKSFD